MKKLLTLLILLCLSATHLLAQNPSKVTIKGLVQDSAGIDQPFATVMLLNPKDSALVNYTRGDDKGYFEFKNVKNTDYVLKISFVGYIPFQRNITPSPDGVNDLGGLKMKIITKELMEVVIRTAKAPLSIRGDTIEYNASSFKVPPGSTVEDLLRRLPGIEVDADGNIKAQGKDVKKLYVDGKTFFGDDPKSATKNLDANIISKVQVFNEKSEQSKLTGVDDGKKEKAMNLELKEEFKKGSFGKISVAGGNEERWAARGNYNKFNKTEQFSILGFGNNINQTGVNWEDYGEFKGQNTFNNDNGDFGFNGNGGGRNFYADGNDVPFNNFDGRGFTQNYGGGLNYNFDNKKTKLNSSYFYNQTQLNLDQFSNRQTFLRDSSFSNTDTTRNNDFRGNHSVAFRFEKEIDSTNTIIAKGNLRFSNSKTNEVFNQAFTNNEQKLTNTLKADNNSLLNSFRGSGSLIFRHRFKKKGESIALSGGYNSSQSDGSDNLFNTTRFFRATTFEDQIRQLNTNENTTRQLKASVLFTEPLSKKIFWESFYNFSQTSNEVRRQVQNPVRNNERIDSISVFYDNAVLYNRLGSSIRYSHDGVNLTAGLAAQQINLKGNYAIDRNMPLLAEPLNRNFSNVLPYLQGSIEFPNNINIDLGYNYGVREPQLNDLQPVANVNNPAFKFEGNPNLKPERFHKFGASLNYWNPSTFGNFSIGSELELLNSQIVYNQTIETVEKFGIRTTTRPDNVDGGYRFNSYIWTSYPLIKTKLTINANGNINFNKSPSFVNGIENVTDSKGYDIGVGLNLTPNEKLILGLRGNFNNTDIKYSIQSQQNQAIRNNSLDISAKWNFAPKFFFESNFKYSKFKNERFNFDREIPIWNASVRRLLTKDNRLEVRLAAFDILNKNVSITQDGSQNFVTRTEALTLARYFMLSLTYNLRGHEGKLKKNDYW